MNDRDREAMDAYLGKNIRLGDQVSSIRRSTSAWLDNAIVRDVLATWLLRKNGPDFPVEADHTLGLSTAFSQVLPDSEVHAMLEAERSINPALDAWLTEGFVSTYRNEDFRQYAPGTVGGIIDHQIRNHGFDITLGLDLSNFDTSNSLQYWRVRARQTHDFEHIITGGQFNSLGEIAVTFGRSANHTKHLSPKLASAMNAYMMFSGLRMVTRSLLHYPETWEAALLCLRQGIDVGLASPPFWAFRWEDVFHLTPAEARAHFGVPPVDWVDSEAASVIFREDPVELAQAAE